jgi:hypothetical protein
MRFTRRTAVLFLVVVLVGCGPRAHEQSGGARAKGRIEGNAKELIVRTWDQVPERPNDKAVDRSEYTGTASIGSGSSNSHRRD